MVRVPDAKSDCSHQGEAEVPIHLVSFISNESFERPVDQITVFRSVAYFSGAILNGCCLATNFKLS